MHNRVIVVISVNRIHIYRSQMQTAETSLGSNHFRQSAHICASYNNP
jgi:hypothetical protein